MIDKKELRFLMVGKRTCFICNGKGGPCTHAQADEQCPGAGLCHGCGGDGTVLARWTDYCKVIEELIATRDIIDGRTTAPTDAEIAAHEAAGGSWMTAHREHRAFAHSPAIVRAWRDYGRESGCPTRWWPLDRDGRPCAWPEVSP